MKQFPKRIFRKKLHKPNGIFLKSLDTKNFYPKLGLFALKALKSCRLTYKQIEAGRKTLRRTLKRGTSAKIHIKPFTYASITQRVPGVRMGTGKGPHHLWVCPVRAGYIIYEISNFPFSVKAKLALKRAISKMPVACKVVQLFY